MRILLSVFLLVALSLSLFAAGQKLVLKDGTYQLVRTFERRGDRVRYFSLERNEWEELPASLVDWAATEKASREEQSEAERKISEAAVADREAVTEKANARLGPEIAPGLHLPDDDGLFVIHNGKVEPLPKQQASARIDKGRLLTNVVLPLPVLRNRSLVEIPGAQATLRLAASPEALFANGRARDDSRYALVRMKSKGKVRQVGAILTNMIGRDPKHAGDYIELKAEPLGSDLFRLTPARSLAPGEYAVVEFLGNDLNMFLWDFAVEK